MSEKNQEKKPSEEINNTRNKLLEVRNLKTFFYLMQDPVLEQKKFKLPELDSNKYKVFADDTKNHIEEMKHGSNNILVNKTALSLVNTFT